VGDERDDDRREWADWAAGGYRKIDQPRSLLRTELWVSVVVVAVVLALIWYAGH
jgi:hypothetical protein